MPLPFDLPPRHIPVIVPRPKVQQTKLADGTVTRSAHITRYLTLQSDRDLFEIGFMLEMRQFAALTAAERFTILALVRLLTFRDELIFPGLRDAGGFHYVESSDQELVWAIITDQVVVTSSFTPLDLAHQGMAHDEPGALREIIEQAVQGCPGADVEEIMKRFSNFKKPHPSDIRRALPMLAKLGIVREYIKVDKYLRHAVFNMRMVAKTRSGILRGMIAAEDHLRRLDGTEISFSRDLRNAEAPAPRINTTSTGRRRKTTKAQYQSKHNSELSRRINAEKRIADYEINGCLTPDQFANLRRVVDDPAIPDYTRTTLARSFAAAFANPSTEIPTAKATKGKRRA